MNKEIIKKKNQAFFSFMRKYIFAPAQAVVIIATIFVIMKTNAITNTANLLQINDAIQRRTDIVFAVDMKIEKYVKLTVNSREPIDDDEGDSLDKQRKAAIISLLNTYEFACAQYTKNKIDKKAFKTFYFDMIKFIKDEYSFYFNIRDGKAPYSAINQVYREWYGK